uniref:Ig-like domain-containing protein n=1 Tax=Fundulus heteroclitus TaxID=8078 RepID=A0A3Q2U2R2_FUNHE
SWEFTALLLVMTHSLKYFYTGAFNVQNFPEFVAVGLVDDAQIDYYDSNIQRCVPKQDWMKNNTDDNYWERQTQWLMGTQQTIYFSLGINHYNQFELLVSPSVDLPSVSFLQKSSSSPVSCHATGFYPNRAVMFWRKDGEEIHDSVEILPNNDGTFQMSFEIDLSSVAPEDWNKYECVFQLSGVREDIVHTLEKPRIRSNKSNDNKWIIVVVAGVVVAVVALLGLTGVIGFIIYKKKKNGERRIFYLSFTVF